jgi:hypothetical protein
MKIYVKALIGGVLVQGAIFLVVYLLAAINIDERAPNIAQLLVPIFYLSIPGILLLVPEGYRHPHHWLLFTGGVLIDILLYAAVILIVLGLIRLIQLNRMRS